MQRKFFSLTSWMILFLNSILIIQAQTTTCGLTYWLKDKKSGSLSSTVVVGTISFDSKDEQVKKSFIDTESGIKIWVGSQIYGSINKKTSRRMNIAIAFGDINSETDDLFRYADSAIAEAIYDKKFRYISVSKTIETESKIYRFRFGCSKNK